MTVNVCNDHINHSQNLNTILEHEWSQGTGYIYDLKYSPDGKILAVASWNGVILLYNTSTWDIAGVLSGFHHAMFSITFSPDGRFLGSTSRDGYFSIWDIKNFTELRKFRIKYGIASEIAWSPDGTNLIVGGGYGLVQLINPNTGLPTRTLSDAANDTIGITSVGWSPDGKFVYASYRPEKYIGWPQPWNVSMKIWNSETGSLVKELKTNFMGLTEIHDAAWSPDGNYLAGAGWGLNVTIWGTNNWNVYKTIHSDMGDSSIRTIYSIAWSSDSKKIATLQDKYIVRVWNVSSSSVIGEYGLLPSEAGSLMYFPSYGIDFSPNDSYLSHGLWDYFRVWNLQDNKIEYTSKCYGVGDPSSPWIPAISPNETIMASGGAFFPDLNESFRIIDMSSGKVIGKKSNLPAATQYYWSPNGQLLAASGNYAGTYFINTSTFTQEYSVPYSTICWFPNSTWIAMYGSGGSIYFWNVIQKKISMEFNFSPLDGKSFSVSPDGIHFAFGYYNNITDKVGVQLWTMFPLTKSFDLPLSDATKDNSTPIILQWSPNGRLLASTSGTYQGNWTFIWNTTTGSLIHRLPLSAPFSWDNGSTYIAELVHSDDFYLYNSSETNTHWIEIWNAQSGERIYKSGYLGGTWLTYIQWLKKTNKIFIYGDYLRVYDVNIISDDYPPQILNVFPGQGSNNINTSLTIMINFSRKMTQDSVLKAIKINPLPIVNSAHWSNDNMSLALDVKLSPGLNYSVTINSSLAKGINNILLDGNSDGVCQGSPMDDYSWFFRTKPNIDNNSYDGFFTLRNTLVIFFILLLMAVIIIIYYKKRKKENT